MPWGSTVTSPPPTRETSRDWSSIASPTESSTTITVNERLGEIATLRAIGLGRATVVRQVLAEGIALTAIGSILGVLLGLATARYLDAILTSFPGLPAAFSFFVPRADTLTQAAIVLLVTGSLAGLYPAWLAARAPIAATLRAEAT
jgi:putative ABC transport system permease protein